MLKVFYGLPKKVTFCKKSLISNQVPNSVPEIYHSKKSKKRTVYIDENGISDPWKYSRLKKKIDFKKREKELIRLLDKHRGRGQFDCVVPGSGGKDSCYAAHVLKHKYGMNPLTVTWPPNMYTSYGLKNFKNWIKSGPFLNISAKRNEGLLKLITKLAIGNLLHPFQTFILGQKAFPIKIAEKYKIPLVFYGENEAEHHNSLSDNSKSLRDNSYFIYKNFSNIRLGGVRINEILRDHKCKLKDFEPFLPLETKKLEKFPIEVHYLGYFLKWIPQETYYYAVENCNFSPRPFRTEGTYSKYNSIDDKIDDLHYYTTFIKFGIGRATYDVSQELRNDHLTIEEGKKLIKKYDGEFPITYFPEIMKYYDIKKDFNKLCDKFRSPHLWKKVSNKWKLRHTANKDGVDD
jgi:N-acetyl sugar amidotransferase|tara:strand:+ start:640 stop:1851 length:1212 start_codon:yes stop_codon:yes gene_type:complete